MAALKTLTINGVTYTVAPLISDVLLRADAWEGSDGAYYQVVDVPGVTSNSKVNLQLAPDQVVEFGDQDIYFTTENNGGVVMVHAIGDKPMKNYIFQATVTVVSDVVRDEEGNVVVGGGSGGGSGAVGAVRYDIEQTLTEEQKAQVRENIGVGVGSNVEPAEDDIPKVFFGGALPQTKDDTIMPFRYISKTQDISGYCKTKAQGSSSMSYPKKNQTVKLYKDAECTEKLKVNFKGWGKENKFCLKANYIDTLHLRNLVCARIAYDMIKSRNDFNSIPIEMQNAPRCGVVDGFPVKVFVNGVLQGIYTWNIPKDKWCMNMDDENVNHAFLMAEKNNDGSANPGDLVLACEFRANATIFADTSDEQYPPYDWVVEGPGDDVTAGIRASFNALINCVKDTDDETFRATIGNHLDLTSAFDYYSFAYLLCHYDGLGKNLGMATYDGQKWFCVLYDMDSTFGAKIDGSGFLSTDLKCPKEYKETNSLLWQRIESCFGEELYAHYIELRSGALSTANILTHAERFYDTIPSEYYAEDRKIWANTPSQDTNTISRLRDYVVQRAMYVDAKMREIAEKTNGITPIVELYSENVNISERIWTDNASGQAFALTGGTPNVNENGLLMTSSRAVSSQPVALDGAFSYDIEFYPEIPDSSGGTANAFFSFNQNNTTKYCDQMRDGGLRINGYSGDCDIPSGTIPIRNYATNRITIVRDATGNTIVYLDNELVGLFDRGTFDANGSFDIVVGASSWDNYPISNSHFRVKSLRIFDYALTKDEVVLL